MVLSLRLKRISDLRCFLFEVNPSKLSGDSNAESKALYRIDTDNAWSQRPDSIIHQMDSEHGQDGDNEIGRVEWSMMHHRKVVSCNNHSIDMKGHMFSESYRFHASNGRKYIWKVRDNLPILIDHDNESLGVLPIATLDLQNVLSVTETSFLDQLVITFVFLSTAPTRAPQYGS